jgi:hypothetical protein
VVCVEQIEVKVECACTKRLCYKSAKQIFSFLMHVEGVCKYKNWVRVIMLSANFNDISVIS